MVRIVVGAAVVAATAAVAGMALAGPVTTRPDGTFLMFDIDVSPPTARSGATLVYDAFLGNRTGAPPPREAGNEIRLAPGFRLNAQSFPSCRLPDAPADLGRDRCSRGSKVGVGTFEADARPTLAEPVTGTFEIFNGELRRGRPTLVLLADARVGGSTVESEIDYEYAGSTLRRLPLPQGASPLGVTLTKAHLELGARRRGKSYVETPRTCVRAWRFGETVFFEGASPISARDTVACVG
jgi:hypothetical protein